MSRSRETSQWREINRVFDQNMSASTALLTRRLLADQPADGFGWLYLGASAGQLSRYTESIGALQRAERLLPASKRAYVYYYFGQLYERKARARFAARWYGKASKLCPCNAGYGIMLGSVLHMAGRSREATMVLRRATRCEEGCREEAYYALACALVGLEEFQGAT